MGGIAVLALIGFLAWFCIRKRKQDKAAAADRQQQQADAATAAAYHATNQMPEMDGTMTNKPGVGAFAPPPPQNQNQNFGSPSEKPMAGAAANQYRPQVQSQYSSGYGTEHSDPRSGAASPPPMYNNPPQQQSGILSPQSQYTELDPSQTPQQRQSGMPPVSPSGTNTGTFSELGGDNRMSYQTYHPPGGQSPPPMPEMGSNAYGGINRPAGQRTQPMVDMNGNPLNENYRPHELP